MESGIQAVTARSQDVSSILEDLGEESAKVDELLQRWEHGLALRHQAEANSTASIASGVPVPPSPTHSSKVKTCRNSSLSSARPLSRCSLEKPKQMRESVEVKSLDMGGLFSAPQDQSLQWHLSPDPRVTSGNPRPDKSSIEEERYARQTFQQPGRFGRFMGWLQKGRQSVEQNTSPASMDLRSCDQEDSTSSLFVTTAASSPNLSCMLARASTPVTTTINRPRGRSSLDSHAPRGPSPSHAASHANDAPPPTPLSPSRPFMSHLSHTPSMALATATGSILSLSRRSSLDQPAPSLSRPSLGHTHAHARSPTPSTHASGRSSPLPEPIVLCFPILTSPVSRCPQQDSPSASSSSASPNTSVLRSGLYSTTRPASRSLNQAPTLASPPPKSTSRYNEPDLCAEQTYNAGNGLGPQGSMELPQAVQSPQGVCLPTCPGTAAREQPWQARQSPKPDVRSPPISRFSGGQVLFTGQSSVSRPGMQRLSLDAAAPAAYSRANGGTMHFI